MAAQAQQEQTQQDMQAAGYEREVSEEEAAQTAMSEYLLSQGFSPDEAAAYAQSPEVAKHLLALKEQENQAKFANEGQFFGTPQWSQDKAGKWHAYQLGSDGTLNEIKPAEGQEMVPPGDIAFAKKQGAEQAESAQSYPAAVQAVDHATYSLDELSKDPNLDYYTGWR